MKEKPKFYFANEDATICHPLDYFIHDAKLEGLTEIELMEAVQEDGIDDFIWCHHFEVVERSECKKAVCPKYTSKSGRGRCDNKGNLYYHGGKVKFKF